jgi:hypothetical protein
MEEKGDEMETIKNDLPGFTFYRAPLYRVTESGRRYRVYTTSPRYENHLATLTRRQCIARAKRMGHRAVFVG